MPAASPLKNPVKVSLLLRRRLRELKRTPRELAEAVKVSEDYMADLVAGRPPPATRDGCTYLQARMRLLEFLDADSASLTPRDCEEFLRPRINTWDIDLETHAMRIVLR